MFSYCQYTLISAETASEFSDLVNDHLKEGWIPYGELIITQGEKVLFSQQFLRSNIHPSEITTSRRDPVEISPLKEQDYNLNNRTVSKIKDMLETSDDFGAQFEAAANKEDLPEEDDLPDLPEWSGSLNDKPTAFEQKEIDPPSESKRDLIIKFIHNTGKMLTCKEIIDGLNYTGASGYITILAKEGLLYRKKNDSGKYEYGLPEWSKKEISEDIGKKIDWKSAKRKGIQDSADKIINFLESHLKIITLAEVIEKTGYDKEYVEKIMDHLLNIGQIGTTFWCGTKRMPFLHYGLKKWFDEQHNVPRFRYPGAIS